MEQLTVSAIGFCSVCVESSTEKLKAPANLNALDTGRIAKPAGKHWIMMYGRRNIIGACVQCTWAEGRA